MSRVSVNGFVLRRAAVIIPHEINCMWGVFGKVRVVYLHLLSLIILLGIWLDILSSPVSEIQLYINIYHVRHVVLCEGWAFLVCLRIDKTNSQ